MQCARGWLAFCDRKIIPQSFRRARICKFSQQKHCFLRDATILSFATKRMLGVLPFVEDPDLSVTVGRTVAQHLAPCIHETNMTPLRCHHKSLELHAYNETDQIHYCSAFSIASRICPIAILSPLPICLDPGFIFAWFQIVRC